MRMRRPRPSGRSGVAALEFALLCPVLLLLLGGLSDFGLAFHSAMQLANGVANAAQYAFLVGANVDAKTLLDIVTSSSGLSNVHSSTIGPYCYCPSGSPPTLGNAVTCGTTCPDGGVAGTYITITASYTYTPMMPGFQYVGDATLSQSATVRLK